MPDTHATADPAQAGLETSPILDGDPDAGPESIWTCKWNGAEYSNGAYLCVRQSGGNHGMLYQCIRGSWRHLGGCVPD